MKKFKWNSNQDINIIFFQENAYESGKCKAMTYECVREL